MKRILSMLFILLMVIGIPMSVFAQTVITIKDKDAFKTVWSSVQNDMTVEIKPTSNLTNTKLFEYDDAGKLTFNQEVFDNATDKSRREAMSKFVNALRASKVNQETQDMIFNNLTETSSDVSAVLLPLIFDNTKADMYNAYKITSPFLKVLSTLIGVGVIIIIALLMITTVADLTYIGLPVAREWFNNQQDKGGKSKPPFVSFDAIKTVNEVEQALEGNGAYKNAYLTYLGRRIWTYIVLAICIFYLVAGGLGGVISWFLNFARSIG